MLRVTLSTFVELVFLYSDNKLKKVGSGGEAVGGERDGWREEW